MRQSPTSRPATFLLGSWLAVVAASGGCGASSEGGGAGGEGPSAIECERMIFQGVDRGFELCASQYVRRREVVACAPLEPRDDYVCESRKPAEDTCTADADCPGGRCVPDTPAVGDLVCGCKYTCVTDDDCGDGYLCECTRYDSRCVPAACRSPSDCGGLECRQWFTGCSGAFACATETDVCRMVEDCYPEGSCGLGEDGRPACVDSDSCD